MYSQDLSTAVIDMGSLTTRVGYAGEDTPKFVCPSFVGNVVQTMQIEGSDNMAKFVTGNSSLYALRDRINIQPVYNQGKILDFNLYENLVTNILNKDMRFNFEEYSFILSESNTHNRSQREKIAQFFYQTLNIKNLFFCKNAVLSCFSTGRSTGLVLDSGAYSTEATTVHDGFALAKSHKVCNFGGESLTQELGNYLQKELGIDINMNSVSSENKDYFKAQLLRNIKETVLKIDESNSGAQANVIQYELPDRQIIKIDKTRISDPFFSNLSDQPFKGIHYLISDNINLCDIDIKKQLYNNIIVTGGNSMLGGFSTKLQAKLSEITAPQKAKYISFPFPNERKFSTWIGGSVLASVASFQSFWVGKQEWSESGISIIEKKCA